MARKRLGEILLEREAITPNQLERGLLHQRQTGERLGAALISLGFITEPQLCEAIAKGLGISSYTMPPKRIDANALQSVPADFCAAHDLFPLALTIHKGRKTLMVAMADPLDFPAIEEISFRTNLHVIPLIAPASEIRTAIQTHYHGCQIETSSNAKDDMVIVRPGGTEQVVFNHNSPRQTAPATPSAHAAHAAPNDTPYYSSPATSSTATRRSSNRDSSLAAHLTNHNTDKLEQLESKFWALLRILTKKGLVTPEEFLREVEQLEK
jgi:hypothetical protein